MLTSLGVRLVMRGYGIVDGGDSLTKLAVFVVAAPIVPSLIALCFVGHRASTGRWLAGTALAALTLVMPASWSEFDRALVEYGDRQSAVRAAATVAFFQFALFLAGFVLASFARAGIARAGRPGAGKAARAVVIGTVPRLAAVAFGSAAIPAAVAAFDPTPVVTAREAFFFLSAACLAPPVLAAIYFGLRARIASLAIAVLVGALALSTPLAHGNYSRNAGEIGSADAFTASVAGVGFYTLVALVGLGILLAARYAVERTLRRTSR